jgi:hypothetical protein
MKPNSHSVIVSVAAATLFLVGCAASAEEPSESQMKEAMLNEMNHPDGTSKPAAAITIKFFKKQGCDAPSPRGINCFFSVEVASTNIGASMYNNIPSAVFYKDGGKWAMRPPF